MQLPFPADCAEYEEYQSIMEQMADEAMTSAPDPLPARKTNDPVTFELDGERFYGSVSSTPIANGFLIFYRDRAGDNQWISSEQVNILD